MAAVTHPPHHCFDFTDYLRLEGDSPDVKHEFLDGQAWAMAGGSPEHGAIAMNIGTLINVALRGKPCRTYSSDVRIRVLATGLATYPDVSVVCGSPEFDPEDPKKNTLVNPRVLVEVLSPSTENYDRAVKVGHYVQIPTLSEIVLVCHDRREVEIVRRGKLGDWTHVHTRENAVAELTSMECYLPLAEIYRNPFA